MRTLGWWHVWNQREDIDDYRNWVGGWRNPRVICSLEWATVESADGISGRRWAASFEDSSIWKLDFARAWRRLHPSERRVVLMRAWGYSIPEIAARTGRTLGGVMTDIKEGRQKLRAACA